MQEVINSAVTTLDARQAQEMLDAFPYVLQRTINTANVAYYAESMKAGKWMISDPITIAHAPDDNGHMAAYLVNGQHRLHAVIEAKVPVTFVIQHIMHEDLDEVARLYGVLDTQKTRSIRDMGRAMRLADKFAMSEWDTKHLLSALPFLHNGFKRGSKYLFTPDCKLEMFGEYAPFMRVATKYFQGGNIKLQHQARRSGPLSVALITIRDARQVYGGEKVLNFWSAIVRDDGLKLGDPRKVAVRVLFDSVHGPIAARRDSQEYTARAIASCFNGWVEDRRMSNARVIDVRGDVYIAGTRFTKKGIHTNGTESKSEGE